jgi:tetratricopeptide (TPR) repeat protein
MNKFITYAVGVFLTCCTFSNLGYGQDFDEHASEIIHRAEEQFNNGNFALASHSAHSYLQLVEGSSAAKNSPEIEKANYFFGVGVLKTGERDCITLAANAEKQISNPAFLQRIAFAKAQYYLHHYQTQQAIREYETALVNSRLESDDNLKEKERNDGKFEYGYAKFMNREYDAASEILTDLRYVDDTNYRVLKNYCMGIISYREKKWEQALTCFNAIKELPLFADAAGCYIAEIHYYQGNITDALREALELITKYSAKPREKYKLAEAHLLAAYCCLETQQFKEAESHFEQYNKLRGTQMSDKDLFNMAFCENKCGKQTSAVAKFRKLAVVHHSDTLGQAIAYMLGEYYLHKYESETDAAKNLYLDSALSAFSKSASLDFDTTLKYSATFSEAKIQYKKNKMDDAKRILELFLACNQVNKDSTPLNTYRDEAALLHADLLLRTNKGANEALQSLSSVKNKNILFRHTYQELYFFLGMQALTKQDTPAAMAFLDTAIHCYYDSSLTSGNKPFENDARFVLGEIALATGRNNDAIACFSQFINAVSASTALRDSCSALCRRASLSNAYLNLGYAQTNAGNELRNTNEAAASTLYKSATDNFSKAMVVPHAADGEKNAAKIRKADVLLMQNERKTAQALYEEALKNCTDNVDREHILLQLAQYFAPNYTEKIKLLDKILANISSPYYMAALYWKGHALMRTAPPDIKQAQDCFNEVMNKGNITLGALARKSMAELYGKTGAAQDEINAYKSLLTNYSDPKDKDLAIYKLRQLCIKNNLPEQFDQIIADNANNIVIADKDAVLDSVYFEAAMKQYEKARADHNLWEKAKASFTKYFAKFPSAPTGDANYLKGRFYRGVCGYNLDAKGDHILAVQDFSDAVGLLNKTVDKNYSPSEIGYFKKIPYLADTLILYSDSLYEDGKAFYNALQSGTNQQEYTPVALHGSLMCEYYAGDKANTIEKANKLLSLSSIGMPYRCDAMMYKAKALQDKNDTNAAVLYNDMVRQGACGGYMAEARYQLAEMAFENFDRSNHASVKRIDNLAETAYRKSVGYPEWEAKSAILWSKVMVAEDQRDDAKKFLNNIVSQSKNQILKESARRQLTELN